MLIEFRVKNFRSIKDEAVLSMVSIPALDDFQKGSSFGVPDLGIKLSKASAIFGANGSGKSNVWLAMATMRNIVLGSVADIEGLGLKLMVSPFLLNSSTENSPSKFEVSIALKEGRYRYGFEATNEKIISEWLFFVRKQSEQKLFERRKDKISIGKHFPDGKGLDLKTRDNALFLSVATSFNGEVSKMIHTWFATSFVALKSLSDESYQGYTLNNFDKIGEKKILKLLKSADLSIESIKKNETISNELPKGLFPIPEEIRNFVQNINKGPFRNIEIKSVHKKFNSDNAIVGDVSFDFGRSESDGTKKMFYISGLMIDSLENGRTLFVDELDARLHPLLLEAIVGMFNGRKNKRNAQLIFCTHNTFLLQKRSLNRDQVWFTEKDKYGATSLFSLADFKKRKDASFEKDYLNGVFGSIPLIEDL